MSLHLCLQYNNTCLTEDYFTLSGIININLHSKHDDDLDQAVRAAMREPPFNAPLTLDEEVKLKVTYFVVWLPVFVNIISVMMHIIVVFVYLVSNQSVFTFEFNIHVQLGLRYEGQLNPNGRPSPHPVIAFVSPDDMHHYLVADGRAGTDSNLNECGHRLHTILSVV